MFGFLHLAAPEAATTADLCNDFRRGRRVKMLILLIVPSATQHSKVPPVLDSTRHATPRSEQLHVPSKDLFPLSQQSELLVPLRFQSIGDQTVVWINPHETQARPVRLVLGAL